MQTKRMKRQLSAACHYSYTRLALNYYMYYETSLEESVFPRLDGRLRPLEEDFNSLLRGFLSGEGCGEESLERLRKGVMDEMDIATAYADVFQAYEYVMNRLEGRFTPQPVGKAAREDGDQAMLGRIMAYIMGAPDAAAVNERILLVLSQLPVRFTKTRFFSLVEEGLSPYLGGPRESLEDMLYILRSEALLFIPDGIVPGYEELYSILGEFKSADYKGMAPEEYRHLADRIKRAGEILVEATSRLMLLMELVNDLYVLFLSRGSAMMEVSEEQCLNRLLSGLSSLFEAGEGKSIPEELTRLLKRLEGRQEAYFDQWMEDGLSCVERKEIEGAEGDAARLYKVEMLLSGSAFMSLKPLGPETGGTVDQAALKEAAEGFFRDFSAAFKGQPRVLVRAVMAKVLSSLPVFFRTPDDVCAYIKDSLESCADDREKAITMKLIEAVMD